MAYTPPPRPLDEDERLRVLESFRVLDTEREDAFDDIAAVAAELCHTPIALVSLIDADRQWYKARHGVDAVYAPRDLAFCSHTILQREMLVVPDTQTDHRLAEHPAVVGAPNVRFYAGMPLLAHTGHAIGTICVADFAPRAADATRVDCLERLGRVVTELLEKRRIAAELAAALENARTLAELIPVCAYCRRVRQDDVYMQSVYEFIESRLGSTFTHGICPECSEREFPGTRR